MSKQTPKQQSLCNNKFDGLMNAAPHKRYKSFAVTVADWESVWLDCDPNQPLPEPGEDDDPAVVIDRLKVYHEQTEPLKNYYEKKNKLKTVIGQVEVADTTKLTLEALNG